MSEFTLSFLWYLIIGICVVFYVALDGFDLGVGIMHFFTRKDAERRVFLNAIGPVWDGNEVWLVVLEERCLLVSPMFMPLFFQVFMTFV